MTLKFSAANSAAVLLAAAAIVALAASPANAQGKSKYDREKFYYGPGGPNVVVQQGPRTRLYISRRSWLDAGTEVLPGDRKFNDYAYPPGDTLGIGSFGRQNKNRPIDRQPLNPPSDLGGYPQAFPIY
jgi:hypothetical protein